MLWLRHLLGLVTLIALVAGGFYLWSLLRDEDVATAHRVTLIFDDARGLREGAGVRYRGVRVGEIRTIGLGVDHAEVQVQCTFSESAINTLRESSRFWIVRPQFRGLVEGASGLDTLIKDPYIVYETPIAEGPLLESGSRVRGLDVPPSRPIVGIEQGARPGDLQCTVIFDENPGLETGAKVLYRGQTVGNVTSVSLAPNGSAVDVRATVAKDYRATVREGARFWIARPSMQMEWMSGLQVHDIERLLRGTALSYAPPEDTTSPPATDNAFFIGLAERPEVEWSEASNGSESSPLPALIDSEGIGRAIVRVHYRFVERDFWSPNDEHRFESLGVTLSTAEGVPIAVVPRSAVDGHRLVSDGIGEPDIAEESWHVRVPDGSVHSAARVWMTDGSSDLALLRLDPRASSAIRPVADVVAYPESGSIPAAIEVIGLGNDGELVRLPGTFDPSGEIRGPAVKIRHGLLVTEGRLIGVTSRRANSTHATLFTQIPPSFRNTRP